MNTMTETTTQEKQITLKRRPKNLSRSFGSLRVTEEQLVLVTSQGIERTREIDEDLEDGALLQEMVDALDTAHRAAQETIAAADRNLILMEQCTRGLQSTLNILRASSELASAQSAPVESATAV